MIAIRISELGRTTGVPVPTIKYYLREGLLPAGAATAPNQAEYSETHVQRLRLVRVLREVGGLGIEAIRNIVAALEDPSRSRHQVLGVAHRALSPFGPGEPTDALDEVDGLLRRLGWQIAPSAPDRHGLAQALTSLRELGYEVDADVFLPYAQAVEPLAAQEVGGLPDDAQAAVEHAVVGTVVYGAALTALRRLAQEHHSAQRRGETPRLP